MNSITIAVQGDEFETINVELTAEEVLALYKLRKENNTKIAELEKKLKDVENSANYNRDNLSAANDELQQAHTLLTALGVADKTDHEESYYRKDLKMATRIALYIAKSK